MIEYARKKPLTLRTVHYTGTNLYDVWELTGETGFRLVSGEYRPNPEVVAEVWDKLHSTWVGVKAGDWIMEGLAGEFYPHDGELFAEAYDIVPGHVASKR